MKHPIFLSVCATLCLLFISPAQAQTGTNLLDSYKLHTKQQSNLALFPDTEASSAQKKLPARLLSPNIKHSVKNNLVNQPAEIIAWEPLHNDNIHRLNTPFASETNNALNLNTGSVGPHIFYAPNESATPAGIVIKPLKNLDPDMVINPDKKPL